MTQTADVFATLLSAQNDRVRTETEREIKLALLVLAHAAGGLDPDIRYIEVQRSANYNGPWMSIDGFRNTIDGEWIRDADDIEKYDVADALRLEFKDVWEPYCIEGKSGTYYIDIERVLREVTLEPSGELPDDPASDGEPMTWRDLFSLAHDIPYSFMSRPVEFQNVGPGGGRFVPCTDRAKLNASGDALQLYVHPRPLDEATE